MEIPDLIPVENLDGYARDTKSGAIICTDIKKLQAYKKNKEQRRRVEALEKDVTEIKRQLMGMADTLEKILDRLPT